MPAGRPSVLTPELIVEFGRLLTQCMYLETVADFLGVERTTWRKWVARGSKESKRLARSPKAKPKPSEALFLEFFHTHKRALAEGEIDDATFLRDTDQWQARAWRLERRFPERWGQTRQEITELKKSVKELQDQSGASAAKAKKGR